MMTAETLLYAGIAAVTTALVAAWGWLLIMGKILWKKSEECEADRKAMRIKHAEDMAEMQTLIVQLTAKSNLMQGQIDAMKACPYIECPMRRATEKKGLPTPM